jgi:hypothetical protein
MHEKSILFFVEIHTKLQFEIDSFEFKISVWIHKYTHTTMNNCYLHFTCIYYFFFIAISGFLCCFVDRSDISKCLNHVENLEESLLRVASLEWPLLSVQRALTHLCTVTVLRKRFEDKKSKVCSMDFLKFCTDFIIRKLNTCTVSPRYNGHVRFQ